MNVIVLKAAEDELLEAKEYYEFQRESLGSEFADAFDEAMGRILAFPEAWGYLTEPVRCCTFKRFEYGILYLLREQTVFVLAVMYLRRKPGYWKRRLKEID